MRNDNYLLRYTGEEVETALSRVIDGEFNGNRVVDTTISYASGTSGTIPPTDGWQSAIPTVGQGSYLWTRTVTTYTDGTSDTSYSVAYQGENGPIGPQGPTGASGINSALLFNTAGTSDTNGYTQAAVNGIVSNPNLLINPDFRINQRGENSYTGYVYGADRWIGNAGTTAEPLEDGGIKLTRSSTGNGILQRIENYQTLVGKTITFSVKCREVISGEGVRCAIYIGTTTYVGNIARTNGAISTLTITVPGTATRIECFINPINASQVIIDYAKLEIGSVATAFTPPNIAEELAKCRRYYWRIANTTGDVQIVSGLSNGAQGFFPINLGVPMRVRPTLTYANIDIYAGIAGGAIAITNWAIQNVDSTNTIVVLYAAFAGESQRSYALRLRANSFLALDAEL